MWVRRAGHQAAGYKLASEVAGAAVRGGTVAMLCVMLAGGPLAEPMLATVTKRAPTAGGPQMQGDARIEHALNRFTFGPRPGDVAAVRTMGLGAWFEQQLNPGKIDDSALEAKLAMFPAMQLPQSELFERYPTQQIIRQMATTDRPQTLPADPAEHAIYADQIAAYRVQQENRNAADPAMASGNAMAAGSSAAPNSLMTNNAPANSMSGDAMMSGGMTPQAAPRRIGRPSAPATPATGSGDMASGNEMASAGSVQPMAKPDAAPGDHAEPLYRDVDAAKVLSLSPDERMRRVVSMTGKEFMGFRRSLSNAELAQFNDGLSPQQRETFQAMQGSTRMVDNEELQVRLLRDIYSNRQLEAVMTDFWLNHFNVYVRKNQNEPYLIPAFERDVIRPNSLGKFEDLLVATAKSPAMLVYLDNQQSIGPNSKAAKQGRGFGALANPQMKAQAKDRGLNENYGRELMELHTLGVNGGYTQADVTSVAKVFTGWTIEQRGGFGGTRPHEASEFSFDDRRHEPGSKTVLGKTVQESGMNEGLQVLHMLASSPATAHFISKKLAVRFVSDDPSEALVERMAKTYLASDGDIKSVLRTMFESPEFWSTSVERAKVKTPIEFVVSAVRASGANVSNAQGLATALDKLGMPLYGMQTPNGYSWMSEPWVSTGALVSRMNFALVMTGDKLAGTKTDWTKILSAAPSIKQGALKQASATAKGEDLDPEVAAKEMKLELVLLGQPVSERTRATVMAQSNDSTAATQAAREFQGGGGRGGGGAFVPMSADNSQMSKPGTGSGPLPARANGASDDRQAAVMAGLLLGSPEFQRR